PAVLETKRLLAEGMERRSLKELGQLLAHQDLRVRQEAQFALADRGLEGLPKLEAVALQNPNLLARLHGIWGVGQVASRYEQTSVPAPVTRAMDSLVNLLSDRDPEVRAQAAKVLGERRYSKAVAGLTTALRDAGPRVRFFAALSLGKYGRADVVPAL